MYDFTGRCHEAVAFAKEIVTGQPDGGNAMTVDPLAALGEWMGQHKSHAVSITHDDGYGASCWEVRLSGRNKQTVTASEVSFICVDGPDDIPPNIVCVVPPHTTAMMRGEESMPEDTDWPGLGPTILAAIKRAEELGL